VIDRLPRVVIGTMFGVSILLALVACAPSAPTAPTGTTTPRATSASPAHNLFIGGFWLASLVLWRRGSLTP